MNFSLKVKDSTNIFTIKKILRERHGQMEDLKICFTAFTEGNEVKNDMLTLAGSHECSKLSNDLMINEFQKYEYNNIFDMYFVTYCKTKKILRLLSRY